LRADILGLTRRAMREAFSLANARRGYPEYFQDEPEFQRWLTAVALRQALRVFLEHRPVGRALNLLPAEQRRVLGMLYLDQLNFSDVAGVLQTMLQEIGRRKTEALDALRQLL
jgi:DNA-directed RNA polymerase specialized sigma24 family protein